MTAGGRVRPEERYCFEAFRQVTGFSPEPADDAVQGDGGVDAYALDDNGNRIAIEITMAVDQSQKHLEGAAKRFDAGIPCEGECNWWAIPTDVNALRACQELLTRAVVQLNSRGETQCDDVEALFRTTARSTTSKVRLFRGGVAAESGLPGGPRVRVMPSPTSGGFAGTVNAIPAAISRWLRTGNAVRHLAKLGRADARRPVSTVGVDLNGIDFAAFNRLVDPDGVPQSSCSSWLTSTQSGCYPPSVST